MQLKCPCGKLLKVPDTAAGKKVKCPGCDKIIQVPGPAAPAAPAGTIVVACSCGKKLAAPASAAGKQVRCPACQAVLSVPGGAPLPETVESPAVGADEDPDGFELDMSSDEPEPDPGGDDDDEYGVAGTQCPECRSPLEAGSQFCVACGTHLGSGTRVDGVDMGAIKDQQVQGKKTRYVTLAIIAGAIIALVVTLIFVRPNVDLGFIKFGSSSSESDPPPDSGPPPPQKAGVTKIKKEADEGYGDNIIRAPTRAKATMLTHAANQAVEAFRAEHGRLPMSREELNGSPYKPETPPQGLSYTYDAKTGKIKVESAKDEVENAEDKPPG